MRWDLYDELTTLLGELTLLGRDDGQAAPEDEIKRLTLAKLAELLIDDSTLKTEFDTLYEPIGGGGGAAVDGWNELSATLTYSSADDPIYVVSSDTDLTSILSVGNKIRFTNNSVTFYGIIHAIGSWSGSAQLITVYGGTDYDVANSAITVPYYSSAKSPVGFPMSKAKWSVTASSTAQAAKSSPTAANWYGGALLTPTGISIVAPIGEWDTSYIAAVRAVGSSGTMNVRCTLSNANNTEEDATRTYNTTMTSLSVLQPVCALPPFLLSVASKTTYYLNIMSGTASLTTLEFRGDQSATSITLVDAYL